METFLEFIKGFSIQNIISVFGIVWFLLRDVKTRLSSVEEKVDGIDKRLIKLEGRFEERGQWEARNNKTQL